MNNTFQKTILAVTLLLSTSSFACLTTKNMRFCINNEVIVNKENLKAKIVGLDFSKKMVSIQFDDFKEIQLINTDELTVHQENECLSESVCVGDKIGSYTAKGFVYGINKDTNLVSMGFSPLDRILYGTIDLGQVASSRSMLIENNEVIVAAEDEVFYGTTNGFVVGVNLEKNTVVVDFAKGHKGIRTIKELPFNVVTFSRGSLNEFKIGQNVAIEGNVGTLVGINKATGRGTIELQQSGFDRFMHGHKGYATVKL